MSIQARPPRIPRIDLVFKSSERQEIIVRVPLNVSPHELVLAARGKFLSMDAVPSRVMRGSRQLAFYDPWAFLADGGVQSGDVLVCEPDTGQAVDTPSFILAYRACKQIREEFVQQANIDGPAAGHLVPDKTTPTTSLKRS